MSPVRGLEVRIAERENDPRPATIGVDRETRKRGWRWLEKRNGKALRPMGC